MTISPLVAAIAARLQRAGYRDLRVPFRIANVEFAFTSAMLGRDGRALDLIILVDTNTGDFGDRDPVRVRQRVESLSRALDVTGSRYVVTVILAGAALADNMDALTETCRVLQVESVPLDGEGKPANDLAQRQLDDRIRLLLPLTLPTLPAPSAAVGNAFNQLLAALPAGTNKALVDVTMAASGKGQDAVTEAMSDVISAAFSTGGTAP